MKELGQQDLVGLDQQTLGEVGRVDLGESKLGLQDQTRKVLPGAVGPKLAEGLSNNVLDPGRSPGHKDQRSRSPSRHRGSRYH